MKHKGNTMALVFFVPTVSLAIVLTFFVGGLLAPILAIVGTVMIAFLTIKLFDHFERRRATIKDTSDEQEA